jgi:transposase-like protein
MHSRISLYKKRKVKKRSRSRPIMQASKKWTMPIRNWKPALNRIIIEFENRISD